MEKILVYDIETRRPVPPKDGSRVQGITYCKGWHDYVGMGIGCLVAYEFHPSCAQVLVYGESDIQEFQACIDRTERCVTYNGDSFDNKLLAAFGVTVPAHKSLDLCAVLLRQTGNRYRLGELAQANFGEGKTEDGAMAPILWQQKKQMRVIRYCISDVRLTRQLYRLMAAGSLICPKTNERITVSLPAYCEQGALL